jgi:glucose/arabinose dehydrogenase
VLYAYDAPPGKTAPYWGTTTGLEDDCPSPPGAQQYGCVVTGRLSKLTATGNTSGPEQVVVQDWCQQFPSHSTGSIAFGKDGYLYASAGDGASFDFTDYGQTAGSGPIPGKDPIAANPCGDAPSPVGTPLTAPTGEGGALRAQDFRTAGDPAALNGSLIRINPQTGAGAPGNPLASSSDPNARRIVAAGMRNPFRIGVHPGTGDVWTGDVGWGTWEEINKIQVGSTVNNFGWPCYEGAARQDGYEPVGLNLCSSLYNQGPTAVKSPFYAYKHNAAVVPNDGCPTGNGSAISGTAFATAANYPAEYKNAMFFADHSRRCIWTIGAGADGQPDASKRKVFATQVNPVQVVTGPTGEIFYVGFEDGAVHRISYSGQQPVGKITTDRTTGATPRTVAFSSAGSTDPDGEVLTYAWDFDGNGTTDSTAANASFTYTTPGVFQAKLRVTDPVGLFDEKTVTITAGNAPPVPVIDSPAGTLTWKVGDVIPYSGRATDPQDGTVPASRLSWKVIMHHCTTVNDCHEHQITGQDGTASGNFTAVDHEYPSWLELRLTATDSGGLSASTSVRLDPKTVPVTLASNPPGLNLGFIQSQQPAPFTKTVIQGGTSSIAAPSPQTLNGKTYEFVSWSDGGAAAHNVTNPATATTLTATYREVTTTPITGLVAAYGFNEGSGTAINDKSGTGNNGTAAATTWTTGHSGGALNFNGSSSMVTIADSNSLDLSAGLTLDAWVKPTTTDNDWRTVVLKERDDGLSYGLYSAGSDGPAGFVRIGAEDRVAGGPNTLPANTWTHIAITYDGSQLRFYVNGVLVETRNQTGAIVTSPGALRIGGNTVWDEYFAGTIDDVRVYNRALTAAQITTDMNTAVN